MQYFTISQIANAHFPSATETLTCVWEEGGGFSACSVQNCVKFGVLSEVIGAEEVGHDSDCATHL